MGFITDEMIAERDAEMIRKADSVKLRKQLLVKAFCDVLNLDSIAEAVEEKAREVFDRIGVVNNVVVSLRSLERELAGDKVCEQALLEHLRSYEPLTGAAELYYYDGQSGANNPRVNVTFSPPLGVTVN